MPDLVDSGLSQTAALDEMPDLESDNSICIQFARQRIDHPVSAG